MSSSAITATESRRQSRKSYRKLKVDLKLLHGWVQYPHPKEELPPSDRFRDLVHFYTQEFGAPTSNVYEKAYRSIEKELLDDIAQVEKLRSLMRSLFARFGR
jgi:hypothetical protein